MRTTPRFVVPVLLLLTACSGAAGQPSATTTAASTCESGRSSVAGGGLPDAGHDLGAPVRVSFRRRRGWRASTGRRSTPTGLPTEAGWRSRRTSRTDLDRSQADGSDPPTALQVHGARASMCRMQRGRRTASKIAFVEAQTNDGTTTSRALLRVRDASPMATCTTFAPPATDGSGSIHRAGPTTADALVFEEDVFASWRLDETAIRRMRVVTIRADGRHRRILAKWKGPLDGPGSPAPDWSGRARGLRPPRQPGAAGSPGRHPAPLDVVRRV